MCQSGDASARVVPAAPAAQTGVAFHFTGAVQEFTVPSRVSEIQLAAIGGGGSGVDNTSGGAPGAGAEIDATVRVSAGEKLEISVGGVGISFDRKGDPTPGGWDGLW